MTATKPVEIPLHETFRITINTALCRGGIEWLPPPIAHLVFEYVWAPTHLYCLGGEEGRGGVFRTTTADAWRWTMCNPVVGSWERLPSMPTRRCGATATVLANCIYVIGGNDNDRILAVVERYSVFEGTWFRCKDMVQPRYRHAAVECNGRIVCMGGVNLGGALSSCETYCPQTNQWRAIASMHEKRWGHAAVVVRARIFCFMGFLGRPECYDNASGAWKCLTKPPLFSDPHSHNTASAFALADATIAVVGAFVVPHTSTPKNVLFYRIDNDIWIDRPQTTPFMDSLHVSTCYGRSEPTWSKQLQVPQMVEYWMLGHSTHSRSKWMDPGKMIYMAGHGPWPLHERDTKQCSSSLVNAPPTPFQFHVARCALSPEPCVSPDPIRCSEAVHPQDSGDFPQLQSLPWRQVLLETMKPVRHIPSVVGGCIADYVGECTVVTHDVDHVWYLANVCDRCAVDENDCVHVRFTGRYVDTGVVRHWHERRSVRCLFAPYALKQRGLVFEFDHGTAFPDMIRCTSLDETQCAHCPPSAESTCHHLGYDCLGFEDLASVVQGL